MSVDPWRINLEVLSAISVTGSVRCVTLGEVNCLNRFMCVDYAKEDTTNNVYLATNGRSFAAILQSARTGLWI